LTKTNICSHVLYSSPSEQAHQYIVCLSFSEIELLSFSVLDYFLPCLSLSLSLSLFPFSPFSSLSPRTNKRLRSWQYICFRYTPNLIRYSFVILRIILNTPSFIYESFPLLVVNYKFTWIWLECSITMKQGILTKILISINSLDYCTASYWNFCLHIWPSFTSLTNITSNYYMLGFFLTLNIYSNKTNKGTIFTKHIF
jgi:hypothetical protein